MTFQSATLHEAAGRIGALPSAIRPIAKGMKLSGPASTVTSAPGNNLWIHRALANAREGDVLVVTVGGRYEAGYWGEIMTVAAQTCGLAGLVIDGFVRDGERIAELGFPVFARGLCIRGTGKDRDAPGALGETIEIGDTPVATGDLVVGDGDGVVVIPAGRVEEVLAQSKEREDGEGEVMDRLRRGETTLEIYGWS